MQIWLKGDLMKSQVVKTMVPELLGHKKEKNFVCVFMGNISQNDSDERCGPWAFCYSLGFWLFFVCNNFSYYFMTIDPVTSFD
jgi:hypothetical protein